jgi:Conjugative transposon protein TraO
MERLCALVLLSAGLLLVHPSASAQRHIRGIKAIDLQGGISGKGWYASAGYVRFFSPKLYGRINATHESARIGEMDYRNTFLNVTPAFSFANISDRFFFSLLLGLSAGLETAKNAGTALDERKIIYGGLIGGEMEVYMGDRVALVLTGTQNYMLGGEIGKSRLYAGGGLRIRL